MKVTAPDLWKKRESKIEVVRREAKAELPCQARGSTHERPGAPKRGSRKDKALPRTEAADSGTGEDTPQTNAPTNLTRTRSATAGKSARGGGGRGWSHGKLERTPASGWLHRMVRCSRHLARVRKPTGIGATTAKKLFE